MRLGTTRPKNFKAWNTIQKSIKFLEFLEKSKNMQFDFFYKLKILTLANFEWIKLTQIDILGYIKTELD